MALSARWARQVAYDFQDHDMGVAGAGGYVYVSGPAGSAEDVAGGLEVFEADPGAAPDVHPLAMGLWRGPEDDRKLA